MAPFYDHSALVSEPKLLSSRAGRFSHLQTGDSSSKPIVTQHLEPVLKTSPADMELNRGNISLTPHIVVGVLP